MTEEYRPHVRAMGDVAPDTRRGGDVRTLLSPKSVGCTSGFMGAATIAPGDWIAEHYHPFSEEFVFVVSGDLVAELDGEATDVPAQSGLFVPINVQAPAEERRRRGRVHRLPPRPAGPAAADGSRRHRAANGRVGVGRSVLSGGRVRRTLVTGIGVVAPGGSTRDAFWETITAGRTATRGSRSSTRPGFRSQIAAECDFDPVAAGLDHQEIRRMDRYVQFAVAAAMEAMRDSGLDLEAVDRERMGVTLGTAVGGTMRLEDDYVAVTNNGEDWLVDPEYARPFLYQALVPSSLASEVALKFGAHGPSAVVSTGCTSGIDAIGYGHQLIQDGEADIVIAGAAESGISPISMACFDPIKATSRRNDTPEHASRPFDRDRDGFVMGEGGAVLMLEELESALARGAHVYCEVAGFASRGNAFHMTGLRPDGLEMAEAIADAMRQGGLVPEDIDYINAHGSGTKQNDRHETAAYKLSLGEHAYKIPISSIKSMVGHSLGGIGAIEMAACALAIETGVIPADGELGEPRPRVRPRLHARRSRAGRTSTSRSRRAAASAASSRR